jgi:uroporphyrinogen-III synthase
MPKELVEAASKKWLEWVEENCEFSVSQGQRYIRIADRYNELLKKVDDPKHLSMTEALRMLSPSGGARATRRRQVRILTIGSQSELTAKAHEAEEVVFPDDSKASEFVKNTAEYLSTKIVSTRSRGHSASR